jgi:hypothetical protein
MFLCKMNKGISNFKNVFDLYGQIGITDVCLDIKKIGIYIYTTYDKSIHTMATFSNASFLEYKCEQECIFTLNIKSMKDNLKNITSVDTIELSIKKEHVLRIKVTKKTIEFEKKIHMKETQFYNLPIILDQVQPLNIKSSDFLELCRSISGKYTMKIKTDDGIPEIAFESEKSKVVIKSDNEEGDVIVPFEGEFKAEYFSKLKKFTKFNTNLKVYTNPDQPLIFETNIGTPPKDREKTKDKIIIWIKSLKQMEEDYEEQEK